MPGLFDGTSLERPVTCEHCGRPLSGDGSCTCPRDASGALRLPRDQQPRVRREKRRGKWCTVVGGLDQSGATDLKAMLKTLRTALGTGGGITETKGVDELVLQGDHREAVVTRLCEMGFKAKAAGG